MKFTFIFLLFSLSVFGQHKKLAMLPKELKEISGLEQFNDSLFIAINDGGNEACLYVINLEGQIMRSIEVQNAVNADWEDLAIDDKKQFLYIGDFGNNDNARKDLCIYKVPIENLLHISKVEAEKISFAYAEQTEIPSTKKNRYFDCEGMAFFENELYLFTKSNSKPYRGTSKIYKLNPQTKKFSFVQDLNLGNSGYFQNSVTAADYFNGYFYLSTYSAIFVVSHKDGAFQKTRKISYPRITQKESLIVLNENEAIVADEKSPIFVGQNIYKIALKND